MSAQAKSIPFFCADCDGELSTATAIRKKDGRVICGRCERRIQERKRAQAQPDLFIEQKGLFNPTRRNVEGFTDASGQFHPIRASKDYNEFAAGDFEPRKLTKRQVQQQREWEEKELADAKEAIQGPKKTLAQFVRASGGIVPGGMFAGEIRRLGYRETGTTGLINQKARQGSHKQTAEYVMDAANVEGYRDRHGERFTSIGDFLSAVEDSAIKGIDYFRARGATAKQRRTKAMAKATRQNPELLTVIDVYGRKSLVSKGDYNSSRNQLPLYNRKGQRLADSGRTSIISIHRSNIKSVKNPGMFGPEAVASARQVVKSRTVKEKGTNERGRIIGAGPKGWLKVQWDNRDKPTLIKRSELKLARGLKSLKNPIAVTRCTSCGQVYGQTTECPMCQAGIGIKRNPKPSRARVIAAVKGALRGHANIRQLIPTEKGVKRERELKARLRRTRTPIAKPKGKLPNPSGYEGVGYAVEWWKWPDKTRAGRKFFGSDREAAFAFADKKQDSAALVAVYKSDGKGNWKLIAGEKPNPRAKGSRDALGVWHAENPGRQRRHDFLINGVVIKTYADDSIASLSDYGARSKFLNKGYLVYVTVKPGFQDLFITDKGKKEAARQRKPREISRNPSVTELAKKFQGEADGSVAESYAATGAPANLARAGKLVFLKVSGRTIRIPGATVAISPSEKLWIVGDHAPLFETKAKRGEGLDVGEITHICYETAKAHIGEGKTYEYVHEFGEEGGKRPHLIIDHEGMPILRGGDYKIKAEGIVD